MTKIRPSRDSDVLDGRDDQGLYFMEVYPTTFMLFMTTKGRMPRWQIACCLALNLFADSTQGQIQQ